MSDAEFLHYLTIVVCGLGGLFLLVILYCACALSARISREEERIMRCGHPRTDVVCCGEGTCYCRSCEGEARGHDG